MARIDDTQGSRSQPQRSLLLRKRWLVLVGLVALVWFAPQLVALTPLLQSAIDRAVPELEGRAQIGSASLGWLSPVVARDIVWRDADGRTLAEVPAVRLERTLFDLLTNSGDLGTIHVEQPHVSLVLRDDGSNLEDALAPLLERPASDATVALEIVVEDASVEVVDGAQQLAWQLEDISATIALPASAEAPSEVTVQAAIHDSQGTPRPVAAQYAWYAPRTQPQLGEPGGTLSIKTSHTPLAMLRPVLRRFLPGGELQGVATCDLQLAYNADGSQQQLKVTQFAARDLVIAAPAWLGDEAVRTAELTVSGDVQVAHGHARFAGLKIDSDLAHLTADGQLPLAGWQTSAGATALSALEAEDYVVHGEIDLAKVAALLPETLRIREGTEITSGAVTLDLTSRLQGKKRRWDGALQSSRLAAVQNGREIVWDEPIAITLAAQQSTAGPVIERLSCSSSFLQLQARGTLEQGEMNVSGDLAQLVSEASRFLDLDDFHLAGKLAGGLSWRREGDDLFQAQGQAEVTGFELIAPGQTPWREAQLTCDLAAAGQATAQGLARLDSARLRIIAGDDEAQAELLEPLEAPLMTGTWPIGCSLRGELARWLPRLQPWLPIDVEQASGAANIEAQVVLAPAALAVHQFKIDVADLRLQMLGLTIAEPEVHASGDSLWTYASGRYDAQSLTVATSALALRGDKLAVEPRASGVAISGEVGYRADLERLTAWFAVPGAPPGRRWSGMTDGRLRFTHQGNVTQAKWTAEFADVALAQPRLPGVGIRPVAAEASEWETVWQEPKLAWHGQGEFDHGQNRLVATHLNVTSDMLNIVARGQIDALTIAPTIDVSGEIAYDLEQVAKILTTYLGAGLKLSGADKRQFLLRGPLPQLTTFASQDPRTPPVQRLVWPKEFVGRAGIGWTSAEMYELPVGPASLDATLEGGMVNFAPLDVPVADGRVKAWPRLVLNNDPMVFQLAKGTQVDQVQITPQMCQTWLKFVAPLLADATRAEGKFSLNVDGATFPLTSPGQGDARGTLTVHGARVGPGPLAEQYVLLATRIRALLERKPIDASFRPETVDWLALPQQNVQLELKGGRVYHRGLQIQIKDTTLVTSGSVGLDQTLSLIVEVPIREEWIAKDRLLSGLRGQSLQIPVGGTVNSPQLDGRALEQLAGQLVQNAAGQLLENKLQEGLNKLLRPKP